MLVEENIFNRVNVLFCFSICEKIAYVENKIYNEENVFLVVVITKYKNLIDKVYKLYTVKYVV